MALTKLDNLYSSKTGKYLYVSPDDFNATDELNNRGNSPLRPFKTIQRAFIEVARYSYLPGKDNDRFDQFSIMLMPGDHYIDNRPGLIQLDDLSTQRFLDAKNLINLNRQEIIDRAFAQIAIDYTETDWGVDWVVPGDPISQEKNRYYDSYRLIQKNRDYIRDKSLAEVAIQFPDFYFPGDQQTDDTSRFFDSYRLIQLNRQEIVDTAFDEIGIQYPTFTNPNPNKCKRDIGYFIDAISLDLFLKSNKYSREFVLQYFNSNGQPINNGLDGEISESVTAFTKASELIKQAITNQLTVKDLTLTEDPLTGSNTSPASCADVRTTVDNLTTTILIPIQEGSLDNLQQIDDISLTIGKSKCARDLEYFIDAISLDISLGSSTVYTSKYIKNYFNFAGTAWIDDGLQGEEVQSIAAFETARDLMISAITNQLGFKELTLTADPDTGSNLDPDSCANVATTISNLTSLATTYFNQGTLSGFPEPVVADTNEGEAKCKRDIGYIIDAVGADLANGGNANIIAATKAYFDKSGNPISDGLLGEEAQSVIAFNAAKEMMKKAVTNQLYSKDLTVLSGPAVYGSGGPIIPILPSGNSASCADVQSAIETLVGIITTVISEGNLSSINDVAVTGRIPVFNYNRALEEWQDNSILDLGNPDNVLYKFNASTGGCIVPRGCSLIGYDLRRTVVRPLYVPDPADGTQDRTSVFNLTGGCYIWQFTIKDGDLSENSPLYDTVDKVGKVYFQKGNNSQLAIPEYSHHKICIMTYADQTDLDQYYTKVARAFALFQPTIDDGDLEALPQENRIVGPLSDTRSITNIRLEANNNPSKTNIIVTTKIAHGYFINQYVAIVDNGLSDILNGTFKVVSVDENNPKIFTYEINSTPAILGLEINSEGYSAATAPALSLSARAQAEIDSVESASPYVFNCSIRSTWGICGMWADGSKATGFKSMVVAQYTGVSLQRDDRAFIRYDEFSNTWNQASLTDAFATVPYHTKGDAYWKDDWRNFHIRASDDAFVQNVSVFAVGFFDHFLMESGGDMSITNSNSNFGNTSLHAKGFKGFSFNQDKGGYITDIVPVKEVDDSAFNETELKYYSIAFQPTKNISNQTKLYYGTDEAYDPFKKPTTSIDGYRLGAKTGEKISLKLKSPVGTTESYSGTLSPNGFKTYTVSLETLNPDGISIDNLAQDASNLIETNKTFIQQEAYGYIVAKYPDLLTNTNITISKCERDIGYFVDAVVQDLRLGGNINTIQAAEGYYVGGQLAYVTNELNETIDALDYVKNLCIAAMRNFDYLVRDCQTTAGSSIVDIGDTTGILVGMKVAQYEYNATNFTNGRLNPGAIAVSVNPAIPSDVYVKSIVDATRIELGTSGSKLNTGSSVNANINSSVYLYFEFPRTSTLLDGNDVLVGAWAAQNPVRDSSIIQDTSTWGAIGNGYPECSGIASTIQSYFVDINLILNQGLTPIGGREIDASNLILNNAEFIAAESVARMLVDFPGFSVPGGNQNCVDDVVDVLETYAYNIKFGGNNRVYDAAKIYVDQPNLLLGEREQSVAVYDYARQIAAEVIRNQSVTVVGTHGLTQVIDNEVIGDISGLPGVYNPTDCADVVSTINTFAAIIEQSIGTEATPGTLVGINRTNPAFNNVTRVEPTIDTANLAARATLFTVDTGAGTSNPHNFETGTPVRLIPTAKEGTNPDKRVIRLPRGFSTNTIYYVIAPGRTTTPEDYSDDSVYPNLFTAQSSTKIMLATTKENAAAGIYIYSSETDAIDEDVEIVLQQYVLDNDYNLHKYLCNFISGQTDVIQTDVPHVFDVPSSSDNIHKVFFRTFGDPSESELPQIFDGVASQPINITRYYYARFITRKTFALFATEADAISGTSRLIFTPGFGKNFYVFADKRTSPVRFDAELVDEDTTTGQWYINTENDITGQYNIIRRLQELGPLVQDKRSKNTFFSRLKDSRDAIDRIYRLRYVIPEYSEGVRDPLNGFVIKVRTDETRKLLPQKILLAPVAEGTPEVAYFEIQLQRPSGGTISQQLGLPESELDIDFRYDPYNINEVKVISSDKTSSKMSYSIQSARQVDVDGTNLLELTVFDHGITNNQIKNEKFVVVRIDAPQGGSFRFNTFESTSLNRITWSGYSAGAGYLQGYFNVPETGEHYLVLKNVEENKRIEFSPIVETVFTQSVLDVDNDPVFDNDGNPVLIFSTLQAKENSVGSIDEAKSKTDRKDYLYSIKDTGVITAVPGDIIEDDDNNQYRIISVEDVGEIEDTFFIFDINTIQRRIPNQQEGIYYLTCVRGNISPYPVGPGVGTNFRTFKFPQPISQLYPLDYKNDPLWFQVRPDGTRDIAIKDVPSTICAADNYIHGLVTTNDSKNSETKEVVLDLIDNPALSRYEYVEKPIEAQPGNATSGSEDRLIPICGDSPYPTEKRLYVELRRPSIARSGNHTFEYLGFGPGNYSTGFPLRQEVVLSDIQDFYAQAKREDGGIVFYTGLNSNGDLYIGNRKINAITGKETFLEKAELTSSADDEGDLGNLVSTFELPVVFEKEITVEGDALFNNPVRINVEPDEPAALTIDSNTSTNLGEDPSLNQASYAFSSIFSEGNITLSKNNIYSAIFTFNPRGNTLLSGQNYSIRTHADSQTGYTPSNRSPFNSSASSLNYSPIFGASSDPIAGDILLKGVQINDSGSLGWILSNSYEDISQSLLTVSASTEEFGVIILTANLGVDIEDDLDIAVGAQVRLSGFSDRFETVNGIRFVKEILNSTSFTVSVPFLIVTSPDDPTLLNNEVISISRTRWIEVGVLGAEAIRTKTKDIGDYKIGINTIARSAHSASQNGFVSNETEPRANLDLVGKVYISGKTLATSPNNYAANSNPANRTFNPVADAFVIGGDSLAPTNYSTLRVDTNTVAITESGRGNNLGRVGINTDQSVAGKELDRALVVIGSSRFTEDVRFQRDIEVYTDGGSATGEVRTGITTGTINLFNDSTFVGGNDTNGLNLAGYSKTIRIGDYTTDNQWIYIGDKVTGDSIVRIGNDANHSNISIGNIDTNATISRVNIGGAYNNNSSNSYTSFETRRVNFAGDVVFGVNKLPGGNRLDPERIVTIGSEAGVVRFFTGNTQTLDFATNASEINIGGQGGKTTVRNNLTVDSSATFNSNVTLCGGFASFTFTGNRGQLGTTTSFHVSGVLGNNSFNPNVDILNVYVVTVVNQNTPTQAELTAGFNKIDTGGSGNWGGNSGPSSFQAAIPGAGPEGAILPALTGNEYYLPVKYKPTPYFQAGDYILIDTGITGSTHPELVRITEDGLAGAEEAPYYLKVRRQPLGTFTPIKINHPDATNIWKCNIAFDATWITDSIDATGNQDDVYLAEFGGGLTLNDYVIIDRGDTNNDGTDDTGEFIKVATFVNQVAKKFKIINGCNTPAQETLFEVDSTTGSVSFGDPGNSATNTFMYGSLTLGGICGATSNDNTKLKFKNELYTTAEIDYCTGDAIFGSQYATVFVIGSFYNSTPAAHSTSDPVYVYRRAPESVQVGGPNTVIFTTQQTGAVTPATSNIPVASISGFQKGDLVVIVDGISKVEVIQITDDPFINANGAQMLPTSTNGVYPAGGRAREGTTAQSWLPGSVVVKIQKDPRTTTLSEPIPATGRVSVEFPNTNPNKIRIKLVNGDLVAEKLDYEYIVRIGTEWFYPDSKNGAVDPVYGVRLCKSYRDPVTNEVTDFFGGGNITTHSSLNINGGNIRVYGTDGRTLVFNVTNDDGHPGDGAIVDPLTGKDGMYLKGFANIHGNLQVYNEQCQENGTCSNELVFRVERASGKVEMGESLYMKGQVFESESPSTKIFHIDNLGSAGTGATTGPKDFIIYQDGSVDAFGITQYFTANGGRRWTYVSQSSTGIGQTTGNPLQPNNNYLVNLTTGGNMIVYLPTNAVTGDIIRFIELSGNLSYNTNLVIRALKKDGNATAIQGDVTGSRITAGSGSSLLPQAWDSGEMIVQTRNASFGLLYVGLTDAPNDPLASEIPSNLRGWWLVEL